MPPIINSYYKISLWIIVYLYIFCINFQLVIVMHKGQVVVHAVIVEYALAMLIFVVTNVIHAVQVILVFLHVQVNIIYIIIIYIRSKHFWKKIMYTLQHFVLLPRLSIWLWRSSWGLGMLQRGMPMCIRRRRLWWWLWMCRWPYLSSRFGKLWSRFSCGFRLLYSATLKCWICSWFCENARPGNSEWQPKTKTPNVYAFY